MLLFLAFYAFYFITECQKKQYNRKIKFLDVECPLGTCQIEHFLSKRDIQKDRPYFRSVPFVSFWNDLLRPYLFSTFFLMNITPTPMITNADITIDIGNMKFMFAPVFEVIITLSAMSSSYSTCGPVPGI